MVDTSIIPYVIHFIHTRGRELANAWEGSIFCGNDGLVHHDGPRERAGTRPVSSLNGKALLTFDEAWGNVRLLVMENKRTSEDLGEGGHGGLVR